MKARGIHDPFQIVRPWHVTTDSALAMHPFIVGGQPAAVGVSGGGIAILAAKRRVKDHEVAGFIGDLFEDFWLSHLGHLCGRVPKIEDNEAQNKNRHQSRQRATGASNVPHLRGEPREADRGPHYKRRRYPDHDHPIRFRAVLTSGDTRGGRDRQRGGDGYRGAPEGPVSSRPQP